MGPAANPTPIAAVVLLVSLLASSLFSPVAVDALAVVSIGAGVATMLWIAYRSQRRGWPGRGLYHRLVSVFFAGVVATLAFFPRWPPGELAGVLIIALPPALAVAGRRGAPHLRRTTAGVLAAWMIVGLIAAASRGAWLALLIAVLAVAASAGHRSRRRVGLAVVALILLLISLPHGLRLDLLMYDAGVGGATLDGVLSRRPQIWQAAGHAVADFPLAGIGPGAFARVVPALYPLPVFDAARPIEHAHQLYLQTALDVGSIGLLAYLAITGLAFVRLRRARASRGLAAWRRALLVALVAHLVYGLGDAVALSRPTALPSWLLLGLALALPQHRRRPRRLALLGVTGALVTTLGAAVAAVGPERAHRHAARALLAPGGGSPSALADAARRLEPATARRCSTHWLAGRLAEARGSDSGRDQHWRRLAACSAFHLPLLETARPADTALAEAAVDGQPRSADALFWLARARAPVDPEEARHLLRRGLLLAPGDGVAWRELGDLLVFRDDHAALEAYLRSCRHGDPQANGCWRAGRTAERLGDLETAIAAYSRSRWPTARRRAEWLAADAR